MMSEFLELKLTIYPEDQKTFGPCNCCGEMTSRVWGYVEGPDATVAAYFVEWTPGHEGAEAKFDFIIGKWGDAAEPSDRFAVVSIFANWTVAPHLWLSMLRVEKWHQAPLFRKPANGTKL